MDSPRDFDIVCLGNANVDTFLTVHDATLHCRVDASSCELCIKQGEKIPVEFSEFLLGGGASNVAVGLTRLGFAAGLIAEIGDDALSLTIRNTLAKEGVYRTHVIQTNNAKTSFTVGLNFKGERTLFVQHVPRKHEFTFDDIHTKWLYIGGLGEDWKTPYGRAAAFVSSNNVNVAFAPGTVQINAGIDAIKNVFEIADIVFMNKEEAQAVLRIKNQESSIAMEGCLKKLQELGPKVVVITDGEHGSFAMDEAGKIYNQPASGEESVEKTGAGDAYASGFLAATLLNKNIEEAMKWGTKNAGAVIGKVGAQPGLLKREEIEKD